MSVKQYTYVGKYYKKYLEELKPYYYIKNQSGFNMSVCPLSGNEELYCIRILGTLMAYFGEDIIPGNYSNEQSYIANKLKNTNIKRGKNFFWNSWNRDLIDNTIFFVGHYTNNKLILNEKIKPYVIHNRIALTNENEGMFKYADVRLINYKNNIYCYDGMMTSIYQIKIINNTIYISTDLGDPIFEKEYFYFKNKICSKCDELPNCYVKKYDKNWAFVDIVNHERLGKSFEFINWFENGYITNTIVSMDRKNQECEKNKIIKMNRDIIDGIGNNKLPMFSFGTPFFRIRNDDKNVIYDGIGCGHIKIITTKNYDNNKLKNFIEQMHNYFKKNYDKEYIEHGSYLYLVYFVRLLKYADGKTKMFISDASLYVNEKSKKKYKFSIFFPMGILVRDDKIIVSCGEGDYYNVLLSFDYDDVLKFTKHDVEEFSYDDYDFILQTI